MFLVPCKDKVRMHGKFVDILVGSARLSLIVVFNSTTVGHHMPYHLNQTISLQVLFKNETPQLQQQSS